MLLDRFFAMALTGIAFLFCFVNLGIATIFYSGTHTTAASTSRKVQEEGLPSKLVQQANRIEVQRQEKLQPSSALVSQSQSDNLEPIPRPRLSSIVHGWNITGDPSWLLQFSIIGFPKSGTSSLMFHLRSHPEIHIFKDERCELASNQHARLIEDLYRQFPASSEDHRFVRGIKCPFELENTKLSMLNYKAFFGKTDFIVGIRHPVLWFESFYNFRIHNQFKMPPAETLIGKCRKGWNNVCTYRSNFHIFLSNLGKTNMTTDEKEQQYVDKLFRKTMDPVRTSRRIFLYEVSQLSDPDNGRALQFRSDLQHYLHLKQPINPFIWFKPGRNHTGERKLDKFNSGKINICDERYDELRSVLLHQAVQASRWIRNYFIHADGVVVSSKDFLGNTLLKSWEHDPCIERRRKANQEAGVR